VDDDDKGITFLQARERWVKGGMKWSSKGIPQPKAWDAKQQLTALSKKAPARKASKKRPK